MITINATGDTTLHTAGKYCAEDILVKVPASSGSGGTSGTNGELVSATLSSAAPFGFESSVYYVGADGSLQTATSDGEISIVKNSIILVEPGGDGASVVGDATIFCDYYPDISFFYVYGDITISG